MNSIKCIFLASSMTIGLGLLYYRYRKRLVSNSHCNQYKIGKEVETFKKQLSPPPPPPPLQQQPPTPLLPSQQQQQLKVPLVANRVTILNERIKYYGEKSINEKTNVIWTVKRKIIKEERKKRLNTRIRSLVYPKSPLLVFSELFKDVPIHLQPHHGDGSHNITSYTATLEIDGQTYSGNHISKTEAKQKACQHFFRDMLAKKLNEESEKNKESPEMEIVENKEPSQVDFPWSNFASLAMHNLMSQWEMNPVVETHNYVQDELTVIKPQHKTDAIIKIKDNIIDNARMRRLVSPKSPLMVFHELFRDVPIHLQPHHGDACHNTTGYTAIIEIDGQTYSGNHISKTGSKQNACQHFFRDMLAKELNEESEKNKESPEMEIVENKELSQVDFPWSNFASLAMHNLMNQWEINPVVKTHNYVQNELTVIKPQHKTDAIIKIKDNIIDNARMRRLVSPKSPLMVFHELFRDVPIHLQPHHGDACHNTTGYTAIIEIDGQTYSGNHISKTGAKQKACQHFFRDMLAKELNEESEKNNESPEMEIGENKEPPQVDFPWSNFASLAMHNLMNQWSVNPVVTSSNYV